MAAMIAIITTAMTKNTPPTSALFDQNPLSVALVSAAAAIVVVVSGGAVGVTVNVSTCPVTVMTDMNGVGVHVLLLEDEVVVVDVVVGVVEVGVVEVDGVVGVTEMGIIEVDVVGGLTVMVDVGMDEGVGVVLVLVGVVEGVCLHCLACLLRCVVLSLDM